MATSNQSSGNGVVGRALERMLSAQDGLGRRLSRLERMERPSGAVRAMGTAIGMLQMFPGLVGLWPGSSLGHGAAANTHYTDLSGHNLDLERVGSTFILGGTSGLYSYYWFNGSTGYAKHSYMGAPNIFDITGTESGIWVNLRGLTIGGWYLFDQQFPAAAERLMGKIGNATATQMAYFLNHPTSGRVSFAVSDGSNTFSATGTSTIPANTWTFVVGRYAPSTAVKIFVNGVEERANTTSIPASLNSSVRAFTVGASDVPGNYLDGQAALLFLCAAAVPEEMIQAFYQYSRGLFGV